MAIDTKAKRASVQAYTFGLMRPPPDGTVGTSDRPTVAWFYAGLTYAALAAVAIRAQQLVVGFLTNVGSPQ